MKPLFLLALFLLSGLCVLAQPETADFFDEVNDTPVNHYALGLLLSGFIYMGFKLAKGSPKR